MTNINILITISKMQTHVLYYTYLFMVGNLFQISAMTDITNLYIISKYRK